MRRVVLTLRVWRFPRLFVASLFCVTVWVALRQPINVIGRTEDIAWPITTLVPAIYASLVPSCGLLFSTTIEQVSAQPPWQRRLCFLLAVLSLGAATVWAAGLPTNEVLHRNMLTLIGVALLSGQLPIRLQFAPATLLALTTWLLGTTAPGQAVPMWATLLHESESRTAWMTCAIALAGGAVVFVGGFSTNR